MHFISYRICFYACLIFGSFVVIIQTGMNLFQKFGNHDYTAKHLLRYIPERTRKLAQENSLVATARKSITKAPEDLPYNFTDYSRYNQSLLSSQDFNPSAGQIQALRSILESMSPGFFLDCGANDGVFISNTLWLERNLQWTGLLVEADPNAFNVLKSVNRKAWISNACFSTSNESQTLTFYTNPKYSEASGLIKSTYYGATNGVPVQCFPLHTMLEALNRDSIDFFSLDVEGSEMDILVTIPFDKITFKVMVIEHLFIRGGKKRLREFMEGRGYLFYRTIVTSDAADSVFIHPSVKLTEEQKTFIGVEDKEKTAAVRLGNS